MYNEGCEYILKKKISLKLLLDLGYLEGECVTCQRNGCCFIQDLKSEEMKNESNKQNN